MKKIMIYIITFFCIVFVIPSFCTRRKRQAENISNIDVKTNENKEELSTEEVYPKYDYTKYATIKLYHDKTGETEELPIDEYLYGVVSSEMPANYELEALKAQAVVARTYTIFQINHSIGKHGDADICDNYACCQAWISKEDRFAKWEESKREDNWAKIENAVFGTQGKIITYNNMPINAFFHSNSGGITEMPVNVWGGTGYPYLQSVETAGEDTYKQYASEIVLSKEELINKLKEKYDDIQINFENDDDIKILEYTEGTRVKTVRFGNHEISGVEARTILGLRSTNFEISKENDKIKFSVKGYGHGVGMSQTGSDYLAKQGKSAEEIINHFYSGVEIKDINSL